MVKRILRLRKRIKILILVSFFLYVSIVSQMYASFWVYPNTTVGPIDISGKTSKQLDTLINSFEKLSYTVTVQNRQYTYTYPDIGVLFDIHAMKRAIFARNRLIFPLNAYYLVQSYFVPTTIQTPLVFTADFSRFIDETIFDFSESADAIVFDEHAKSLEYIENEERYLIDESYLKDLLIERIGNNTIPLYPKLVKIQNSKAETIAGTSTNIKRMFLSPLTVILNASGNSDSFILTESELVEMTKITLSESQTEASATLHDDILYRILNDRAKKVKHFTRGNIVTPKVRQDLQDALMARMNGHTVDAITIDLDSGPNSVGTIADKYIEVDISQQKMYLFKKGKIIKTYRVSTGLEYPTPTGEFVILNKSGLGFSKIYNVWMPYWMGFKYSTTLHAYFGIHEVPYSLTGDQKIERPAGYIGTPNTGGCVALGIGDAKTVYQFADIGTKVVIYN